MFIDKIMRNTKQRKIFLVVGIILVIICYVMLFLLYKEHPELAATLVMM